jgi:molecular chaperone DnaK (HSP70)
MNSWWKISHRQKLFDFSLISGFSNISLINSTTSAAACYLKNNPTKMGKIAIADFGDNSFNSSIFHLSENSIAYLCHKFDIELTGHKLTDILLHMLIDIVNPGRQNEKILKSFKLNQKKLSINQSFQFDFFSKKIFQP